MRGAGAHRPRECGELSLADPANAGSTAPSSLRLFHIARRGGKKRGRIASMSVEEDAPSSDASPRSPDAPAHAGSPARGAAPSRSRLLVSAGSPTEAGLPGEGWQARTMPCRHRLACRDSHNRSDGVGTLPNPVYPLEGWQSGNATDSHSAVPVLGAPVEGSSPSPRAKGYRQSHSTPTRVSSERPLAPASRDAEAPDDRVSPEARRSKPPM